VGRVPSEALYVQGKQKERGKVAEEEEIRRRRQREISKLRFGES